MAISDEQFQQIQEQIKEMNDTVNKLLRATGDVLVKALDNSNSSANSSKDKKEAEGKKIKDGLENAGKTNIRKAVDEIIAKKNA